MKKKIRKMNAAKVKAYEIGVKEVHAKKRIVPALKSEEMMAFMAGRSINKLLPLLKAYDLGVAYEINRQTRR